MMKSILPLVCLLFAVVANLQAQESAQASIDRKIQYKSPLDEDLAKKQFEVEYFTKHLEMLKIAFASRDASNIVANESILLGAMRIELQQMQDKVDGEKIQSERRKHASDGNLSMAAPAERPKTDPLADPETPSEKRLESMRYVMGAFQRHAFDPGKPEEAKRDFAKLDEFVNIMQEDLAELKKVQEGRK
jgi:hypothetical protein